ncbi:lipid II flippase family protein [Pararhodobacter oceanensis]|uniref:lipid II flippase family protein n=1 Tax=Pararhodobacter oceanensis TaxID=2172121 RepID=UPI001057ED4E|nr:DUF2837 family protein [Pararhodobacter oceanensis]
MSFSLVFLVPICFAAIHLLEFTGIMARLSGIRAKSHMLGYSIQQAVYVGTRLFIVALLPMLGLIVDTRIDAKQYMVMAISALAGAAILSLSAYILHGYFVGYYDSVILKYKKSGNFATSFFSTAKGQDRSSVSIIERINLILSNTEGRRILIQSAIVFAIYGTGIFISFYFALLNFEYRASISQLSGVVNSIGTVLLTFFIEPRISRGIDAEREDAEDLIHALLIGRLFGVAVLGQVILMLAFVIG